MAQQMLTSSGLLSSVHQGLRDAARDSWRCSALIHYTTWTSSSYKVPLRPAQLLTFEYRFRIQEETRKKADVAPWRAVYWPGGCTGATRTDYSKMFPIDPQCLSYKDEECLDHQEPGNDGKLLNEQSNAAKRRLWSLYRLKCLHIPNILYLNIS